MQGEHVALKFAHRSLGAKMYTTTGCINLNKVIMRDDERAGHLYGCKTSEKTSLTDATMPRKLICSVLVKWTMQRRTRFQ